MLLAIGVNTQTPRLPHTAVGVAHLALGYSQPRGWAPKGKNLMLALQAVFHLLEQLCFCPIGISVMLINDVSLTV